MPNLLAKGRRHLIDTEMGYFAHLRRAATIGARLIGAGGACLVHGILPGLFPTRASSTIISLHEEVATGHAPPRSDRPGQGMWLEFEI